MINTTKWCSAKITLAWTTSETHVTWTLSSKCSTVCLKLRNSITLVELSILKIVKWFLLNASSAKLPKFSSVSTVESIPRRSPEPGSLMKNKSLKPIKKPSVHTISNFWLLKTTLSSDLQDNKMLKNICSFSLTD